MAKLKTTIVFGSGARIGPGTIALLKGIRDTRSISAAARSRAWITSAWTPLESVNQAFNESVVVASPGGTRGDGAPLPPFGLELLERYRRIEQRATAAAAEDSQGANAHIGQIALDGLLRTIRRDDDVLKSPAFRNRHDCDISDVMKLRLLAHSLAGC